MPLSSPVALRTRNRPNWRRWRLSRPTLVVLAISVLLLAAWKGQAPRPIVLSLLGLDLALVVWAVRARGGLRLVGPLLAYDLARLARRGSTPFLRCSYGLLVLGVLWYLVAEHFPEIARLDLVLQQPARAFQLPPTLPVVVWGRFAHSFVATILTLQGTAVLVLTPAYLAGAIAEEKEHKTALLLFTTDLHDREILLGKLFGRLLHLGCILLTSLPILCLARLWGGVDGKVLFASLGMAAASLLSVGSVSILCSVLARSVLVAVVSSYVLVGLASTCYLGLPETSPILFMWRWDERIQAAWVEWQQQMTAAQPLFVSGLPLTTTIIPPPDPDLILLGMFLTGVTVHGVVFLLCTGLAVGLVREMCLAPGTVVSRVPLPRAVVVASWDPIPQRALRYHEPPSIYSPTVPVREPALLWKEMYHGSSLPADPSFPDWQRSHWRELVGLVAAMAFFIVVVYTPLIQGSLNLVPGVNGLLRVILILVAGAWCLVVGFRVAGSISHERDQRTLETLLLLPVERREILGAKWLGSILRYRHLGYVLAGVCAVGFGAGLLHAWAVLLWVVACGAHLAFLASLGLWLSLASRNTLWANMTMALVLLLVFGGSWMGTLDEFTNPNPIEVRWLDTFLDVGLNPGRTWWYAGFSWQECTAAVASGDRVFLYRTTACLAGALFYGAAAWLFWRLACRFFEKKNTPRRNRNPEASQFNKCI